MSKQVHQVSNVVVASEVRLQRGPDGSIVCPTGTRDYTFWSRYLDVFRTVTVVARVNDRRSGGLPVEGDGVRVHAIPDFGGGVGLARRYVSVMKLLGSVVALDQSAYILRVPGILGNLLSRMLATQSKPFAVEVVGDPHDVFAPSAIRHPLRPVLRHWMTRSLRRQCRSAVATAYVTQQALQRRYPPSPDTYTTHYSSVELPPEAFASEPRRYGRIANSPPYEIVGVGRLNQAYKGADVLVRAIDLCRRRGMDVRLTWLGDGHTRGELERLAAELDLSDHCRFVGDVPAGSAVRGYLDTADLFVMPSRTEGLPRAMIEAMARGVPCIGSAVGGIPELLEPFEMSPPDDPDRLAQLMMDTLRDPLRMSEMSERNLRKAANYAQGVLRAKRRRFYEIVRDRTSLRFRTSVVSGSPQIANS